MIAKIMAMFAKQLKLPSELHLRAMRRRPLAPALCPLPMQGHSTDANECLVLL